jgi:hypothetical protein
MPNVSHQDGGGGGGGGSGGVGVGLRGGTVDCVIPGRDSFSTLMSTDRLTFGFLVSCNVSIRLLRASVRHN